MPYKNILTSLGLSEPEAAVYDALLELGLSPASAIIKKTGLKRGHVYHLLYSLIEKGLAEQTDKNKKAHFRLTSPVALQNFLEKQRKNLEDNQKTLETILPSLFASYQLTAEKPTIQFSVGIGGLKKIYEDVLLRKKPLFIFASRFDRKLPELDALIRNQIKKQYHSKIEVRSIVAYTDPSLRQGFTEFAKKYGVQMRALKNFILAAQILCYDDIVALTTFKTELVNMTIENKDIAATVQTIFDQLWETAEPIL
jgi:sugar-specific transcriptional regulator TrmB